MKMKIPAHQYFAGIRVVPGCMKLFLVARTRFEPDKICFENQLFLFLFPPVVKIW